MSLLLIGMWVSPASADADGDGYNPSAFPFFDCDDLDPSVNPAEQEVIGDLVDQDCDSHDALKRALAEGSFSTMLWSFTGSSAPTGSGGTLRVGDGSAAGKADRNFAINNTRGGVWLVADLDHTGAACSATLTVSGVAAVATIAASGMLTLTSGAFPPPPRTVSKLSFSCPAGGQVDVDWYAIQNSGDAYFPPIADVSSATWEDVNAPGGGGVYGAMWAYDGWLVAGGDAGGVGIRDTWATSPSWQRANGTGATGLQDTTAWDVIAVDWDGDSSSTPELFAITGELAQSSYSQVVGGFWRSDDAGETWQQLADTLNEGIGTANRWTECGDKTYNAGNYLAPDEEARQIWVASNYQYTGYTTRTASTTPERDMTVTLWSQAEFDAGGSGFCELPVPQGVTLAGLPDDQIIGAIALSRDADLVRLVVGTRGSYSSGGSEVPSLYVCEIPSIPGSGGSDASSDVDCASIVDIECTSVAGSEGLDITDLEVDPIDPDRLFVAEGGIDPDDTSDADGDAVCHGSGGGVWELVASTQSLTSIGDPTWYDTGDKGVSGVSVDPEGNWLFAFLPGLDDAYADTPIFRLDLNGSSGTWTPALHTAHQAFHAAHVDYSGGWYEADLIARPWSEPELYAPRMALDATWYLSDEVYHAVVMTPVDMWDVVGLDASSGTTFPWWDGDYDTEWTHWPEPDEGLPMDFQTMGAEEIALDSSGNLWLTSRDKAAYVVPRDSVYSPSPGNLARQAHSAERDCLFEGQAAGGGAVSASALDGTVWLALFDQTDNGASKRDTLASEGTIPHDIGVYRTVDEGGTWEYMGAGYRSPNNFKVGANEWSCRDGDPTYTVTPFDAASANPGVAFTDDPYGLYSAATGRELDRASWGNPVSIIAVTKDIAVVAFNSWSGTGTESTTASYTNYPGRLAYTLDGGESWLDAGFDPGPCEGTVDKADYFFGSPMISLKKFEWDEASSFGQEGVFDPLTDEWSFDVLIGVIDSEPECSIARVHIDLGGAVWDWYTLPNMSYPSSFNGCAVDPTNFMGIVASPWSDEAFIWGSYDYHGWEGGGVCALNLQTDVLSKVANPNDGSTRFALDIGSVAPNPEVANVLAIGTYRSTLDTVNCMKPYIADVTASPPVSPPREICPEQAGAFVAERSGSGWEVREVPGTPSGLTNSAIVWGGDPDWPLLLPPASTFFYSTYGPGTWRVRLEW